MNTRTRNPAVGIASASVSRYDTSRDRYITTDSARYGTTEVARSKRLRARRGRAYGASTSCHDEPSWTVGAAANELTYPSLLVHEPNAQERLGSSSLESLHSSPRCPPPRAQ